MKNKLRVTFVSDVQSAEWCFSIKIASVRIMCLLEKEGSVFMCSTSSSTVARTSYWEILSTL